MNNKGVTLEAEIPLYWISEKSDDPILHVTPGEKKKKSQSATGKGREKQIQKLSCTDMWYKNATIKYRTVWQIILVKTNRFLDKRIFMASWLFKDEIVLFMRESQNLGSGKAFRELDYFPPSAKRVTPRGQGSYFLLPLRNVHNAEWKAVPLVPLNTA